MGIVMCVVSGAIPNDTALGGLECGLCGRSKVGVRSPKERSKEKYSI